MRRNSMGIIVQEFNMWKCAFIGSLCLLGGTIALKNGAKASLSFNNPCFANLLITTTRHIGTGAKAFCYMLCCLVFFVFFLFTFYFFSF